tara:strand:+ start:534 stop:713 length:180 start_codon:yes stop_codon:yes gene_type:complete
MSRSKEAVLGTETGPVSETVNSASGTDPAFASAPAFALEQAWARASNAAETTTAELALA